MFLKKTASKITCGYNGLWGSINPVPVLVLQSEAEPNPTTVGL